LSKHPTPDEMEALLKGNLSSPREWEVVRHLLSECEPCRIALSAYREPLTDLDEAYDDALDRAFRKARSYARHLRHQGTRAEKASALLSQGGGLRSLCTEGDRPLRGLGVYQALLERSWAIRHHDKAEMVELAQAAVNVALRLNPRLYGPMLLADLQARAWGELGNAHRAADDLDKSEQAFGKAFELHLQGTGDLHLKARLYDLYASFLGSYRRFDLAFAALDIVHSTYIELGDRHLAARALVTKAIYTLYRGRAEEALVMNEAGREILDKDSDPRLYVTAIHNRLACLVACGRFREASKELFENRAELDTLEGRLNAIKMRWLEGQISAGLERWKSAEIAMVEARDGFEEACMGYHAALVSLELALLWMRQNRLAETEKVVKETFQVFVSLKIHREAIAAMQILNEARERKIMTVTLLDSVVKYLHRAQHDPDVPFVPKWE
jgi:tetratricopeptide (TPR) repeat protein